MKPVKKCVGRLMDFTSLLKQCNKIIINKLNNNNSNKSHLGLGPSAESRASNFVFYIKYFSLGGLVYNISPNFEP